MRWLSPQELARVSGKAERTIRHYASQGRIKVKKEGKNWLIEPMSALAAGIPIPADFLASLRGEPAKILPQEKNSAATTGIFPANKSESEKKYKRLSDLGVYRDLLELYREQKENLTKVNTDYVRRCLQYIALGFYEYSRDKKAEYFKQARVFLVSCLVEDDIDHPEKSAWREQVESAIIPGVIGLIRKQERRSHDRERKT